MTSELNWETYKQIPVKLREEFNHKFGGKPKTSIQIITNTLIFVLLIIGIIIIALGYTIQMGELESVSDIVVEAFNLIDNFVTGAIIFFIIILILDVITIASWTLKRRSWLKEHNIKRVYPFIDKIRKWHNERK